MTPEAPPELQSPSPRFRLLERLGRGSMGVVYAARDEETGQEVALKTLDDVTGEGIFYLKQEFRVLSGISHENLVQLYELDTSSARAFFTMERVRGADLLHHLRQGDCGPGEPPGRGIVALGEVFLQLATGLAAVHDAGKLHRDVKPANVLVAADGRVVILDFGLSAPRDPGPLAPDNEIAGTPLYMAPEAYWGPATTPATDWYSFGVVLHEALTGAPPFSGSPEEILMAKERGKAEAPSVAAPWVPGALDDLVRALLHPDPARRPRAEEIREALRSGTGAAPPPAATPSRPHPAIPPFVGRRDELAALRAIAQSARPGAPAVAHVIGTSGIGKSELVRAFLASVEGPSASLVLRARCHPLEAVAYKAVDGIVDDLTKYLVRLDARAQAALVPEHAGALVQLFPVLARVPAFCDDGEGSTAIEPHEVRRQAFGALRRLLGAIGADRPVVLAVDDVHWGDADGLLLLEAILRPPDAPGLTLVLSYRSEDIQARPLLQRFAELGGGRGSATLRLDLPPLSRGDVQTLVAALLAERAAVSDRVVGSIAAESGGSPLLAGELARALGPLGAGGDLPPELRVDTVISDRVRRLPTDRRQLLELVSVAGRPIEQSLALGAAGLGEGGRAMLYPLIEQCLLRGTMIDGRLAVAAYHDRIREAVVASLAETARRQHHLRIAETVRAGPRPDPQVLTEHYFQAGEESLAAGFAVDAGDAAAHTLAFDRAAELYRLHARLRGADTSPAVHVKLAESLANAGRGADAGRAYAAAAGALAAADPRSPEVIALRRRSAEHLLRSGNLDEGNEVMRSVLEELRIEVPKTPAAMVRSALWNRARLLARGLSFQRREAAQIPPAVLARLDAIWGAGTSVTMIDYVPSDALSMIHLFGALEAGEPSRVLRAFGWEASFESTISGAFFQRRADRLLAMADELAESTGLDYDRAWVHACRATVHWQRCMWVSLVDSCEKAIDIFRTRCRGTDWEIAVVQIFALAGLANVGCMRRLIDTTRAGLDRALERGDRFAASVYQLGLPSMAWLAQDRPDEALARADEALRNFSAGRFNLQHYHHLLASTQARLYAGEIDRAWDGLLAGWPALEASAHYTQAGIRCEMAHLRGRAALAMLGSAQARGLDRWRLRYEVERAIRVVRRTGLPTAAPLADALEAGRSTAPGEAERWWRRAREGFARVEMRLYEQAAARRLGELRESPAAVRESEAWMEGEGVVSPARMAALLSPAGR